MDGKQQRVLQRSYRVYKGEMPNGNRQASAVNRVILRGSLEVGPEELAKEKNTGEMKQHKAPSFGKKGAISKKVSPIIISQYRKSPITVPTPKSSLESKSRLSTKETEKVYLSSAKPRSRFIRKRVRRPEKMKPARSVSTLLKREKKPVVRGKSASFKPKLANVNRIQCPPLTVKMKDFDTLQRNERRILEQNRRENLEKEQIKEIRKYEPVYKPVDPSMIKKEYPSEVATAKLGQSVEKTPGFGQTNGSTQITQSVYQPVQSQAPKPGLFYSNGNHTVTQKPLQK